MKIEKIQNFLTPNQLEPKKGESTKTSAKANAGDKLEISADAKKMLDQNSILAVAKAQLAKIPDIRQTKVDEVKGKVASNYYNDGDVITQIADKMASSPELYSVLADQNEAAAKTSPEDVKKFMVIYNRMDRNFYDSVKVLDKIAENILKDLGSDSNNSEN